MKRWHRPLAEDVEGSWAPSSPMDPDENENVALDHPLAVTEYGLTAWEETHAESLDRALAREVPEPRADLDDLDDVVADDLDDEAAALERRAIAGLFGDRDLVD